MMKKKTMTKQTKKKLTRKNIDYEQIAKDVGFVPHEGQKPIIKAYLDGKREIVWVSGRRSGKALDIETPILTTNGWKKMGDLIVGDVVFGQDGKRTKVIWVSDIMFGHKCYDVKFSDGSVIKADEEHLWTIREKGGDKKNKTTQELIKDYKTINDKGEVEYNYSIDPAKPIEMNELRQEEYNVPQITETRYIIDISETKSVPVRCIKVDNKDHLYLAGKSLIATHNSNVLGFIATIECCLPNRKIWIVAPDYGLTEKVFNYLLNNIVKIFPEGSFKVSSKAGMSIRFSNGTIVECKSADNSVSLLGDELDLLIIDEAAVLNPNIYERYLFATTAMRKGTTIFISTPVKKNWFFRKYKEVQEREDGFVWNTPSSINPHLPREEIERAKQILPADVFKQEYEAQFLDAGQGVFRGFMDCVLQDCYEEPIGTHRYIMGVDLAKVNDFTVITIIDKQTHRVVYWDRFNGIEWNLIIERIKSAAKKYNNAKIIIDSTGLGNPITETLKRQGLKVEDFKFSSKSKKDLVDKLSIFLEYQSVFIPDEPILLDELDCFACDMTESGVLKYSAPSGKKDDSVMSLGLAVWELQDRNFSPLQEDLFKVELKNMLLEERPIHRTRR